MSVNTLGSTDKRKQGNFYPALLFQVPAVIRD